MISVVYALFWWSWSLLIYLKYGHFKIRCSPDGFANSTQPNTTLPSQYLHLNRHKDEQGRWRLIVEISSDFNCKPSLVITIDHSPLVLSRSNSASPLMAFNPSNEHSHTIHRMPQRTTRRPPSTSRRTRRSGPDALRNRPSQSTTPHRDSRETLFCINPAMRKSLASERNPRAPEYIYHPNVDSEMDGKNANIQLWDTYYNSLGMSR